MDAIPACESSGPNGQAEPLNEPSSHRNGAATAGPHDQPCLFATDSGNGFITRLGEFQARTRTGKSVLTVPKGSKPLIPSPIYDIATDWICAIHSNGNLLVFGADDIPEMARGKDSRLLGIPAKKFASGEERMVALASVPEGGQAGDPCREAAYDVAAAGAGGVLE